VFSVCMYASIQSWCWSILLIMMYASWVEGCRRCVVAWLILACCWYPVTVVIAADIESEPAPTLHCFGGVLLVV
jgi:hypothetical protein